MTAKNTRVTYYETIISVFCLLLLWQLFSWALKIPALPGPIISLQTFYAEIQGTLFYHFQISTYRVLLSLFISLALAVPLGMFLGREGKFDRFISPLVYLIYPIPKIVFLPVLMALLGLKDLSKIALIVLVVFFQILVTTRDAARGINNEVIHSVISLGASKGDLYRHVVLPAVIPEVLTSLRIASGTAIAVLFFSETVASQEGLGYYLLDAWSRAAYPEMFAGIIAMGMMGYIIYKGIDLLEKRICQWKYKTD
ncbi:ABC transporter permease [Desulforamulus aquiferis]|uniref:ABC transporter permease n=1 Tax=Desulforamulus aquiferis TaxID=1397668 RepID=A0AAW7ZDR3_9FIRM|nr:ABC transporter permease [Desulforamulus aquiferis]MDO7787640.1 ABC transporter permease [Desulforamulus aquiferis]